MMMVIQHLLMLNIYKNNDILSLSLLLGCQYCEYLDSQFVNQGNRSSGLLAFDFALRETEFGPCLFLWIAEESQVGFRVNFAVDPEFGLQDGEGMLHFNNPASDLNRHRAPGRNRFAVLEIQPCRHTACLQLPKDCPAGGFVNDSRLYAAVNHSFPAFIVSGRDPAGHDIVAVFVE